MGRHQQQPQQDTFDDMNRLHAVNDARWRVRMCSYKFIVSNVRKTLRMVLGHQEQEQESAGP